MIDVGSALGDLMWYANEYAFAQEEGRSTEYAGADLHKVLCLTLANAMQRAFEDGWNAAHTCEPSSLAAAWLQSDIRAALDGHKCSR